MTPATSSYKIAVNLITLFVLLILGTWVIPMMIEDRPVKRALQIAVVGLMAVDVIWLFRAKRATGDKIDYKGLLWVGLFAVALITAIVLLKK